MVVLVVPSTTVDPNDVPGRWLVAAADLDRFQPNQVGETWVASLQKPGEKDFTPLRAFTITPFYVGGYTFFQLWYGEFADGGDLTPPGTGTVTSHWSPGVATFKLEITSQQGLKTWALAPVPVHLDPPPVIGPVSKAEVSVDGRSIFLTPSGLFNYPVAYLGYYTVPVHGTTIEVPEGVRGTTPLVIGAGYPTLMCVTFLVTIPNK